MKSVQNESTRPWRLWALSILYFLLIAGLFSVWRLPHEDILLQLQSRLQSQLGIESRWRSSGNGWMGSLHAEGLQLLIPDETQAGMLELEEVAVGVHWSTLFSSRPGGWFQVEPREGELIRGSVRMADWQGRRLQQIQATTEGVSLDGFSSLPRVGHALGTLRLDLGLEFPERDPTTWRGRLELGLQGASFRGLSLGNLSLESLPLGNLDLEAVLEAGTGRLELTTARISGGEVDLFGSGGLRLSPRWNASALDLQLRFRLSGQMDANYSELLELMQYQRDAEGWFHLRLQGSVGRPNLRPGTP